MTTPLATVPDDGAPPSPPADLGERGRDFWTKTLTDFDLYDHELLILEEICRTLDDLKRLSDYWATADIMVKGSAGQQVLSGVITEMRQLRLALARLLSTLNLPTEEDDSGAAVSPRTLRNRANAAKGWARARGVA